MVPVVMAVIDVIVPVLPILADLVATILEVLTVPVTRRESILQLVTALARSFRTSVAQRASVAQLVTVTKLASITQPAQLTVSSAGSIPYESRQCGGGSYAGSRSKTSAGAGSLPAGSLRDAGCAGPCSCARSPQVRAGWQC
jgi:hypothetical protein